MPRKNSKTRAKKGQNNITMSIPNPTSNGNMSGSGDAPEVNKSTVAVEQNADADGHEHEPVETIQQAHSESGGDTPSIKIPIEHPQSDAEDNNTRLGGIYLKLEEAVGDDERTCRLLREIFEGGYPPSEPIGLSDIYQDWGQNRELDRERLALDVRIVLYIQSHMKCIKTLETWFVRSMKEILELEATLKEKTKENKTLKSANRDLHQRLVRANSKLPVENIQLTKTTDKRVVRGLIKQSTEPNRMNKNLPKESIESKDNKVGKEDEALEPRPSTSKEVSATSALELTLLPSELPQSVEIEGLQLSPNSASSEDLDEVQPASGEDE